MINLVSFSSWACPFRNPITFITISFSDHSCYCCLMMRMNLMKSYLKKKKKMNLKSQKMMKKMTKKNYHCFLNLPLLSFYSSYCFSFSTYFNQASTYILILSIITILITILITITISMTIIVNLIMTMIVTISMVMIFVLSVINLIMYFAMHLTVDLRQRQLVLTAYES